MQQITNALTKAEFEIYIEHSNFGAVPSSRQLYHYTNNSAKPGIVVGKMLDFRLTKTSAFLDQNEGTSILEPYYHACGHLYEEGKIDYEFFMMARSITAQMLRNHNSNHFSLCLTPHGCSSFMKERYAAKDGWIISFYSECLYDLRMCFPERYGRFECIQIQYSFKQAKRLMESILKKIFRAYKEASKTNNYDPKDHAKQILLHAVYYYGLRYKGKDYQEEKEERLLFHLKKVGQPFTWERKSKKLLVTVTGEKGEEEVHLILGPSPFYSATQELKALNDERLNCFCLKGETIQKVHNERKT